MEPTKELVDAIFRERVLRARRMPPEDKLLEGVRLFDNDCRIMKERIRNEFPDADEEHVNEILIDRINLIRQLEELGVYMPLPGLGYRNL
jgi:hypothetical protein